MVEVIWTEQAVDSLNQIAEYIAQDSERYASAIVEKIYLKVALLKTFPLSGRIVPEIGDETIRELIEGNY